MMAETNDHNDAFFAADLDPQELRRILDRIDENLSFRHFSRGGEGIEEGAGSGISPLPSLARVRQLIHSVGMSTAPLYPSIQATGINRFLWRLKNLFIKMLGSNELAFNQLLRELLGEVLQYFQALKDQSQSLALEVDSLDARLEAIEHGSRDFQAEAEALRSYHHDTGRGIGNLQDRLRVLEEGIGNLGERVGSLEQTSEEHIQR